MHVKFGLGIAVTTALAVAVVAPAASARPAAPSHASPMITQTYTCTTPIGNISLTGTVTGKASIKGTKISLHSVKYVVNNSVGLDLTIDHVKISTPDPSKASAPYKNGSVKVAKKPKGWKAGHDKTGVFAAHAGSMTVANGDNVMNAALSAQYTSKGEPGTEIDWMPGSVTFNVSAPVAGAVSCTPDSPVGTFASVTE